MANDFIKIARDQSAATEAAELLAFKNTLRSAYETAIRIRDKMRHNFDSGETIDWSAVETLWGIPTGRGADVFTFLDGIALAMTDGAQNDACKVFTEQVG